jgi:hypothetical protein
MRFMNPTSQGGHAFWGLLCWAGSTEWGTWWLGIWRWRMILKAPWNEPLFSERYGHATFVRLGFGWRVRFRLAPHTH